MTDPASIIAEPRGRESAAGRLARLAIVAAFAAFVGLAGLFSLPPLDRDESRFAQATAQMLETGDYLNIRFQEAERNKKPAGIYWMQAASVAAVSDAEARAIWAYRLPSLFAAILAAVFTYLAGARLYGPATSFLGALLLAAAPGFAGEASIAKTDAMLLALVAAAQAAFVHIYARARDGAAPGAVWPAIFWVALGLAILVKGPIAPMIIGLTAAWMALRGPRLPWIRGLRPIAGAALLVLIVAPWAIAIGVATEGRFFAEAVGVDMLGKVGAAQERHSGPPGYHFVLAGALLWPATALLLPGLFRAVATRAAWPSWYLLGWIVPAWIVFEATATKLPHYTLPLFPALALLAARAASPGAAQRRDALRRFGAFGYGLVGVLFGATLAALPIYFGAGPALATIGLGAAVAVASLLIARLFWRGQALQGAYAAALLAAIFAWTTIEGVLPRLQRLHVSPNIAMALDDWNLHPLRDGAPVAAIAGYAEPSAVFLLGTRTVLTDGAGAARHLTAIPGAGIVVEAREEAAFQAGLAAAGISVRALAVIDGLNYSNGRAVRLTVYASRT